MPGNEGGARFAAAIDWAVPPPAKDANTASGRRRDLAVLFVAVLLCGALAAESVAQYQPRSAQLPATGERPSRPDNTQMVQPGSSEENCKRRWLEYERSQACFAPYRTVSGMKPEAYSACGKDLPDPSAECGPPRPQ